MVTLGSHHHHLKNVAPVTSRLTGKPWQSIILQKSKQLEYTGKLLEIRIMLSQSKLRSLSSQSIPAFVKTIPGKTEEDYTEQTAPVHGPSLNTIGFPVENLVFPETDPSPRSGQY